MENDFSFDFGNDVAFAAYTPIYDFDLLDEAREAVEGTNIEEEPEFRARIKDLYNAARKLHETLRSKMTGKLQKFSAHIKKAVPIFSAHSRVRSHRSPARSRSSSSTHDDDGDGGGNSDGSDSGEPPGPSHHTVHTALKLSKTFYCKSNSLPCPWRLMFAFGCWCLLRCSCLVGRWAA